MAIDTELLAQLNPQQIRRMDIDIVQRFNSIVTKCASSPEVAAQIRLQHEIGPFVFDGRPETARLAILTGNPGFGDDSTALHHTHQSAGWHVAGLSPDAPLGSRRANQDLFGALLGVGIDRRRLSDVCLKLELIPWASRMLISNSKVKATLGRQALNDLEGVLSLLPSRKLIATLARALLDSHCLVAVLRGNAGWRSCGVPIDTHPNAMLCASPNLKALAAFQFRKSPGAWERIVDALRAP